MTSYRQLMVALSTAIIIASSVVTGTSASPAEAEGCVAGAQTPSCSYQATTQGNVVGSGTWVVTVARPDGKIVKYRGEPDRFDELLRVIRGAIRPGDTVSARAVAQAGEVRPSVVRVGPDVVSDGCTATAGSLCSFRASRAGGILAIGNDWFVHVERNREWFRYASRGWLGTTPMALRERDVIRLGDRVTVWGGLYLFGFVGVGADYND